MSGNFGYMGKSNPWADLDQMWRLWGDMVDVITCAIFRDCRLRSVGVVRGISLPSPIDLTRRPYNTGHTAVWPCDGFLRLPVAELEPPKLPEFLPAFSPVNIHNATTRRVRSGPMRLKTRHCQQGCAFYGCKQCYPKFSESKIPFFGFLQLTTAKAAGRIFTQNTPKHAVSHKDVPFRGRQHNI